MECLGVFGMMGKWGWMRWARCAAGFAYLAFARSRGGVLPNWNFCRGGQLLAVLDGCMLATSWVLAVGGALPGRLYQGLAHVPSAQFGGWFGKC